MAGERHNDGSFFHGGDYSCLCLCSSHSGPDSLPFTANYGEQQNGEVICMSDCKEYLCVVCGFVYSEAAGLPEEGIAPGTRWADIPDSWVCPECGASKEDFEMVEV
jgi:rubredoxin